MIGDARVTFAFTPASIGDHHYLEISVDGAPVGGMEWHAGNGTIRQITIAPEYRRNGLATRLWMHARASLARGIVRPVHSARRTDDGDAWALSLGSMLPERITQ